MGSVIIEQKNSDGLSSQLVMIIEYKTGKRVIKARPVKYDNKVFITAFPNPVQLLLSSAIDSYNLSEEVKKTNFIQCGKQYGEDVFLLDIEENGTHDCYNQYIKLRITSIVMLVSSIEAFMNHIIPNDFKYRTVRKNKSLEFNKEQIESPKISFNETIGSDSSMAWRFEFLGNSFYR